MSNKKTRRPISNFFIKKALQFRIIGIILFIVFLTSCITTLILSVIYNAKSQEGNYYYMSNNIMEDLELTSILGTILPALITAQVVSLVIAVAIGMFSSRKAAVPVYKLEKWATLIKNGRLKSHIGFRETKEMKDLTIQCNSLADTYKQIFLDIDQSLSNIIADRVYKSQTLSNEIANIQKILAKLEYKE